MAVDIKTFLLDRVKEINPDIDRSPGSVFYDFFINPLSLVLEDYRTEHDEILSNEAASTASDLTTDALDALGMNFLLERTEGAKAVGYVTFYFNNAVTLNIPKDSIIKTEDNLQYKIPTAIYVPKNQMENNISSYPYYDSGLIPIVAMAAGTSYNKPSDTRFYLVSTSIQVPVKITNANPISSGTAQETNDEFFDRIQNSVFNNSLASPGAIDTKVKENYTSVVKTETIGANHPLMKRDLTSLSETVARYVSEDYLYTYSGQHTGSYDKKSIAYWGAFNDTDETEDVAIPAISGWSKEFSNDMYEGVYLKGDMNYAESEHNIIMREYFGDVYEDDVQVDLALILASGNYEVHDGLNPSQSLFYVDEVSISNNQLVLGKTLDPNDANNANVAVPLATISGLLELVNSELTGSTESAAQTLGDIVSTDNFNNVSPIFHKQIDQHLGVEIDCTMSTTDGTDEGEMAYITVLRHADVYIPHDGYGLAWRKQPDYLVRLNRGAGYYTDADVTTFQEQFGVNPVTQGLVGNDTIKNNSQYWQYNVYLVDNDSLQEEVWIGHDQVWDQTSGQNQFLVAGKAWIEPNITYKIKIKIYQTLGAEIWVHENDNPPTDPYSASNRKLYRGATYPPYLPVAGEKVTRSNGTDTLETTRSHFGIAVSNTRNYEWYVDDLVVRSFVETFPMHLFRMSTQSLNSTWDLTGPLRVEYYGVGYDPVQYALDGSGHSKVKLAIYNNTDDAWESVGTHTYTIDDSRELQKITKSYDSIANYVDDDQYVNFAALPMNTGSDFPNDTEHYLASYYIKIDNTSDEGVHRGNAIDVYVHDPNNLQVGTAVVAMNGNSISTSSSLFPGFIAHIREVREYISKVPFDSSSYSITNNDEGVSFSESANYTITFDMDDMTGALVEVEYLYWTQGSSVDDLLTSSDSRYPASDIKVKTMPLTIVTAENLQYSGGLAVTDMRLKIIEYFNSLEENTFDKSDLVNLLYNNGANYVDLDMSLKLTRYGTDFTKEIVTVSGQTYVIPQDTISAFYTSDDELTGVEQS